MLHILNVSTYVHTDQVLTIAVQAWKGTDQNSRQRGRQKIKKEMQMSKDKVHGRERKIVMGPRWWPESRTDCPTDRRS
jgi:hypothetical protein